MATLFEIGKDLQNLEDAIGKIADAPQEFQEQLEAVFLDMKNASEEELRKKLDSYANLIAQLQTFQEIRRKEAARLNTLAAGDAITAATLQARLKDFMIAMGYRKLQSNFHKFSVVKNGGLAPLIYDEIDPADLPPNLQKTTVQLDKAALRDMLEGGVELEWAKLGERGSSVRIS